MSNKYIISPAVVMMVVVVLLVVAPSTNAADRLSPEQLVAEFQKVPHYEMFCNDESRGRSEPVKVGEKFKVYLSREFYRLFLWSQCGQPEVPSHRRDEMDYFDYDIRNNMPPGNPLDDLNSFRIKLADHKQKDKAIVNVNFKFGSTKMFTSYTLIREDGQWKIDDIAPQADYIKNPKNEKEEYANDGALDHSDSIKADMQGFYRAAEKRYQEEQAKKR